MSIHTFHDHRYHNHIFVVKIPLTHNIVLRVLPCEKAMPYQSINHQEDSLAVERIFPC